MDLVDMHDALVVCLQQQAVQVGGCAKVLTKNFTERNSHFMAEDTCQSAFAHPGWTKQKAVRETGVVLKGCIKSDRDLFVYGLIPNKM